jgi:hypothetical protein
MQVLLQVIHLSLAGRSPCFQVASFGMWLLRFPYLPDPDVLYCSCVAGDAPHSTSNDMMSVDTPAASSQFRSRRGSPQRSSQLAFTGLQV